MQNVFLQKQIYRDRGERNDLSDSFVDSNKKLPRLFRDLRHVHTKISDSEYEIIKGESRANLEPLTRKHIKVVAHGHRKEGVLTLYFIESEKLGLIKIGKTGNPIKDRLSSMQSDSPDKLNLLFSVEYDSDLDFEGELHRRFAGSMEHGEWV